MVYSGPEGPAEEDGSVDACRIGLVYDAPPFPDRANMVEYSFRARAAGPYYLTIVYASEDRRAVTVKVNEEVISNSALDEVSGSWCADRTIEGGVGRVHLENGADTLRLERTSFFPHLKLIRFVPAVR